MKRIAWIFPGQGAQSVGMAKELYATFAEAREVINFGCEILGRDMKRLMFEGPEEELTATHNSQVAIFLHSMAMVAVVRAQFKGVEPQVVAGLSLGEFTAVTASGRLSFEQMVPLVQARGRFMSDACEETKGGMAAIIGLDDEVVERVVAELRMPNDLWIANYNCPKQLVVSGTIRGIERGVEKLKEAGARRALPLQVHGAFHSGLMAKAQSRLAEKVNQIEFAKSDIDLVMNVPGDYVQSENEVARHMIDQVTHSVRWKQGIERIAERGVDLFVEMGPGQTLAGMNKRISVEAVTLSLERPEDLDKLAEIAHG
jgi:[acyl-carrier-protein] S-malonyltransferase